MTLPSRPPRASAPPQTGDPVVDKELAGLDAAATAPLEERLEVLERVHRSLAERLADIED